MFFVKKIALTAFFFVSFLGFTQEQQTVTRYYFKLDPKLNFETPTSVLNTDAFADLAQNYNFTIFNAYGFTKQKIEQLFQRSKSNHSLKNTFRIEAVLDNESSKTFLKTLQNVPNIIYAYQSPTIPIVPPHDIAPTTDNLENTQGYIESNPGMNVRYAWNLGINGAGINIKTIEYGINLNHEELDHKAATLAPNTTINSGATIDFTEHGTSVAGIIYGDKGSYGISGLAHGANEYILYPEWTEEYGYNRVLATSNAIANSNPGDLIIYEMQAPGQSGNYVPAEYNQAIWDLTKAATDAGIVIVAAAGNGSENLDAPFYSSYIARGDSGAIIVGAGNTSTNHTPKSYTSHGSRVNVQSWGSGVSTIGYSAFSTNYGNDFNQSYISNFGGTSSATALIGGFTAVLQSYYFAQTGGYLTSQELRTLMVNTGIPQGAGVTIGPIPNMEAAILELDNTLTIADNNFSNFIMYPNPAQNVLNIRHHAKEVNATLEIYNSLGKRIFKTELTTKNNTVPLHQITPGLYLVTLKTKTLTSIKKLIIN